MVKKIPVYEARVNDADDNGIFAMSFVDFPAVERNFVALNRQKPVKLALNKQKQILSGVVLVPDKLLYRNDEAGEYYLKFTAADIEKIAQKMMRTGVALFSTTHQHEKPLEGNYLVECWTVADPKRDKSVAIGLGELPVGTLCASYKITDGRYWQNEVISGNVKGFSLEGFFNLNNVTVMKKTTKAAAKPAAKKGGAVASFFKSFAALLDGETEAQVDDLADVAADDETDSGEPYLVFELAEGGELYVDEEGFATINDEQAPAGEHALADGNFIVIDDAGLMVLTEPEADAAEPEAAELAAAKEKKIKEAKLRAKQFLKQTASDETKKPATAQERKIAALEKQLAELKKQPSAPKARAKVEASAADAPVKRTDQIAEVIRARRERSK